MAKKMFKNISIRCVLGCLVVCVFAQKAEAKTKHPLVGIWTLTFEGEHYPIVCYKILKKNGDYVNMRSTDMDTKHFAVSHYGKFKAGGGWYVEQLKYEKGRKLRRPVDFPLNYEFVDKNTVKISYGPANNKYTEVWHRTTTAPKYEK